MAMCSCRCYGLASRCSLTTPTRAPSAASTEKLWQSLCPLTRRALANLTVENFTDWGTCIAMACEGRDPRKLHWLFELLMGSPLSGEGGSFRDASVLTYIFMMDVALPGTRPTASPRVAHFVERLLGRLQPLMAAPEIQNQEDHGRAPETDQHTQAIKLLKTVLKWLMASAGRTFTTPVQQQLQLLPLLFKIAPVESDESFDEMKQDARTCLSLMSQGLLYPQQIALVLDTLEEMAGDRSWHARFLVLTYLQVMVFYHLFTLLAAPAQVLRVHALLMRLLLDEQLEVRDMAGTTLSGLLQCQFFPLDQGLQTRLQTLSQTRLSRTKGEPASTDDGEEDAVGVPPHAPRQLATAPSALHRRPAAGAHQPAGVALLLRLEPGLQYPQCTTHTPIQGCYYA